MREVPDISPLTVIFYKVYKIKLNLTIKIGYHSSFVVISAVTIQYFFCLFLFKQVWNY